MEVEVGSLSSNGLHPDARFEVDVKKRGGEGMLTSVDSINVIRIIMVRYYPLQHQRALEGARLLSWTWTCHWTPWSFQLRFVVLSTLIYSSCAR